jgi:membrane protein
MMEAGNREQSLTLFLFKEFGGRLVHKIDPMSYDVAQEQCMAAGWFHQVTYRRVWALLKDTATAWSEDKVPRHGAALAYYTVFSIVPLLVVVIAIIGLLFGREATESYILDQIADVIGPQSAEALKDMLQRANQPSTGIVATVTAIVTLLLGASGVFGQLQDSLNSIWGVRPKEGRGIWGIIKDRFISFSALLGTAFLLLVSLVISAGLAAIGQWFGGWLPAPEVALHFLEFLLSFALITGLFAMMFKLLPDARVAWSDVWIGAGLTALLFTVGKFALGLYLGKSDIGSAYGAAGSLVILLVWVYYSAQIVLFGAEFTQVYASAVGRQISPDEDATVANPKKAQDHEQPVHEQPVVAPSFGTATYVPKRVASDYSVDAEMPRAEANRWIVVAMLAWTVIQLFVTPSRRSIFHGDDPNKAL